jgi:hypothetical protein
MEKRKYNSDRHLVLSKEQTMGFLQIPNVWFMVLMADEKKYQHVPASFWKFLFILWHEIMFDRPGKPDWTAKLSMREFGVRANDASKWAAALKVARLFQVTVGTFQDRNRTIFTYNTKANSVDWQGFYRGLMAACAEFNGQKKPTIPEWEQAVENHVRRESARLREQLGLAAA